MRPVGSVRLGVAAIALTAGGVAIPVAFADASPARAAAARAVVSPTPAVPAGARLLGGVPANRQLSGDVALYPRDPAGLEAYAAAVTSPGSALNGRYLTPGQFAAEFGPSVSSVESVTAVLRAGHLRVDAARDGGLLIDFSGSAREVGAAFGTSLANYRLSDGRIAYAETSAPTVPLALSPLIEAVVGLDDLTEPVPVGAGPPRGGLGHGSVGAPAAATRSSHGPVACPAATADAARNGGLTDAAIAHAYGVDGLYHEGIGGQGETVAVFELEPFEMSDLRTFDSCFFGATEGKAIASRVTITAVDGGQQVGTGSGEAILDLEDVTALAPDADYDVYEAPETNPGDLDNYAQFVENDSAQLLTSSWGDCEPYDEQYIPGFLQVSHVLFEQAAAQGQTILNAVGDTGSDCMAEFGLKNPILSLTDTADDPWVLGVGGTTITDATDPPAEQVWNDGPDFGAGSGGISAVWAAPAWQLPYINSKIVAQADKVSGTDFCGQSACREVPDVSAQADEFTGGITVFGNFVGGWTTFGGTSSSSPLWAGILADVGSTPACQASGHSLGFVTPKLYAIAADAGEYQASFNDITKGNNDEYGYADGLYPATTGYDMASGLGSPRVTGPGGSDGLAYNLCHPTGSVPTVTNVDSDTDPGTNTVPADAPGAVVVTGSGFEQGGASTVKAVTVGNVTAAFHVTGGTTMKVKLPSAAAEAGTGAVTSGAGTHNLTVTLTDGQTSAPSRLSTVVYYSTAPSSSGNPVVDDVIAPAANRTGGELFRIYGAGFKQGGGTATVTVGGASASHVTVVDDNLITADSPTEPSGACLHRQADIGPGQTSFDPAVDTCQVRVLVTVAGHRSPPATIKPEFQGPVADENAPGSATESYPGRDEFDYLPTPKITDVDVDTGTADERGGSTATITGSGLGELGLSWYNVGPYKQYLSANYRVVSVNPTRLVVVLPGSAPTATPQNVPVTIETTGSPNAGDLNSVSPSNALHVTYEPTPVLASLHVLTVAGATARYAAGPTSGGTKVELIGTGFGADPVTEAADGSAEVVFTDVGAAGQAGGYSDATVSSLLAGSETEISFNTLGDDAGIDQVSWCNVSGCTPPIAKEDTFTYYPLGHPAVSGVSPTAGFEGSEVTISGHNLGFVEAVYFGSTRASVFANAPGVLDSGSTSQVTAKAPYGEPGKTVEVRVVTLESEATGYGKSPANPNAAFTYRCVTSHC